MKRPRKTIEREKLPGRWEERLCLGNGRELRLRPIDPRDREPIAAAFSLLHEDEIRSRYMYTLKALSPDYLQRLTHPQRDRDFVLVAAEPYPPGEALIGAVARLSIDPDNRSAEFAILVSHFLSGHGLGRLMMRRLLRYARLRKLERIHGEVLEDNRPMLELAESLGFERQHLQDSGGTARVVLELGPGPSAAVA